MPASYLLTTEPWLPLWDLDASAERKVGLSEALLRAHRLVLPVTRPEDVAALRLLAAVYDAAAGPRDTAEWDAAWRAETLEAAVVTTYLEQWADHLDLHHPVHPAFQCGALTEYTRGPEALHPGSLGGDAGTWFNHELLQPLPPYPADRAAQLLLHLLTYDVAGIKRAAPGDPATKSGKVYGSQIGPAAGATHCHLAGATLKDTLLLNLPPQPRAAGDTPVWERDTPTAPMRTRTPVGRLDVLTWPGRRIRLHATENGTVDAVAHHDGDRMTDSWQTTSRLDPMTAWSTSKAGKPIPLNVLGLQGWTQSWRAACLLHSDRDHSAALQHATAAAERGTLAPDMPIAAVLSATVHTNRHQVVIGAIPVTTVRLGTAAQLAEPAAREQLATMARYAGVIGRNLVLQAVKISGRSADLIAPRMQLVNLDGAWDRAIRVYGEDREKGRELWHEAVHEDAQSCIDAVPLDMMQRAKLLNVYHQNPNPEAKPRVRKNPAKPQPARRRPAGSGQRGPAVTIYEAFGGRYTLSRLSKHPDCVVSYPTLRKRVVEEGWDVTEAATTPRSRGPRTTS
ncbi:type I-E CRISPR-associated protein Cse1/CasA [Streptomyces nodosus]|uniref:type I-E CRISPR-associated protein Cse1/CasA n=1 Tax=Streptomyces nodosus TaxID=40318 RepID=UPI003456ACB4